jgi:hypothetical protein
MSSRGGNLARSARITLVVVLTCAVGVGVVDAAKKKGKKLPRGPYPGLGKCGVFPKFNGAANAPSAADQTAWNQDISQAPLDPNSGAIVNHILANGGDMVHPDFGSPREYGFPYAVVGKKQKPVKVKFTAYGDESTKGKYRVPLKALVEGGASSDGDRHVLAVDRARCKLFELYRAFPKKAPKRHWNADSAVIWNLRSAGLRTDGFTSADAAGLPIFPGLANFDQARSGTINHAFRMTVSSTRDAWIHPASHCAGDTGSAAAPPMGLRLRLNGGYNVNNFTGEARAIAVALKRYGVIIADNGSNWFISGTSDKRWNDENLNQLKDIPGNQFEVVRSAAPVHTC